MEVLDGELKRVFEEVMRTNRAAICRSQSMLKRLLATLERSKSAERQLMSALLIKMAVFRDSNAKLIFHKLDGIRAIMKIIAQENSDNAVARVLSRIGHGIQQRQSRLLSLSSSTSRNYTVSSRRIDTVNECTRIRYIYVNKLFILFTRYTVHFLITHRLLV